MRRKLFTFAAGMSAVLCVLVCVLWVRSGRHGVLLSHTAGPSAGGGQVTCQTDFSSAGGRLGFSCERVGNAGMPPHWERQEITADDLSNADWWDDAPARFRFAGVQFDANRPLAAADDSFVQVYAPHWLAALLFALLPAIWVTGLVRRRRRVRGQRCAACGYDLRATPERCPECGTVAVAREGRVKT
jgi:hypothetical protein